VRYELYSCTQYRHILVLNGLIVAGAEMKNLIGASVTSYLQYSCIGRYSKLVLSDGLEFTFCISRESVYDACTHRGICGDASDLHVRCHKSKKKEQFQFSCMIHCPGTARSGPHRDMSKFRRAIYLSASLSYSAATSF